MDDNKYLVNKLKKMTLEELCYLLTTISEKKNITNTEPVVCDKTLYTIDELIQNYPFFTRYNINKAIQEKGLPYFAIGNKKLFEKKSVDEWLEKETKTKNQRMNFKI